MKKKLALILSVIMIFSTISNSAALANNPQDIVVSNYLYSQIVNKKDYQKIKITNLENGEIEYLESFIKKDGTIDFLATTNDGIFNIESNEKEVILKKDNVVIEVYNKNSFSINTVQNQLITPMAYGQWGPDEISYGNRSFYVGISASVLTGIIGGIFSLGTTSSIVTSIVSVIISEAIGNVWYKYATSYRIDIENNKYERRVTTTMYRNSNYTGQIGRSNTKYSTGPLYEGYSY